MAFWQAWRKRWAIRAYVRRLPRLLARDYGRSDRYTPGQVRRTIERHGLNQDYSCYAISMFSDRSGFDQYHQVAGEHCDYDAMRAEVASAHFGGNVEFGFADVWDASDAGHAGGGGDGHDGGSSDGGSDSSSNGGSH